jgi:hypothetical protein
VSDRKPHTFKKFFEKINFNAFIWVFKERKRAKFKKYYTYIHM